MSGSKSVGSMAELALLFGQEPHVEGFDLIPGAWFHFDERQLVYKGQQFSDHGGSRPVVLIQTPGPNAKVYTRSSLKDGRRRSSDTDKRVHERHKIGHAPRCALDKEGEIILHVFTVETLRLSSATFRCHEPRGSSLLSFLQRSGS